MDKPEIGWKKDILQDKTEPGKIDSNKEKQKSHRLSSDSQSSSSSSTSSTSSDTSGSTSYEKRKKEKKEKRESRKKEKLLKKEKKKLDKAQRREIKKAKKEKRKEEKKLKKLAKKMKTKKDETADCSIPIDLMYTKANAPETKEEYEARQNKIRREVDPVTGRTRLIKGDGEILEEIVSKDQHREINKKATQGDGEFFQSKTVGWKLP